VYSGSNNVTVPFGYPAAWGTSEGRELALPLARVRAVLANILESASGMRVTAAAPDRWIGRASGISFFDCDVLASAEEVDGDISRTRVEIRIQFEPNAAKLAVFVWLIATLVGIPLASRWRARSTSHAERRMKRTLEEAWSALDRVSQRPYR